MVKKSKTTTSSKRKPPTNKTAAKKIPRKTKKKQAPRPGFPIVGVGASAGGLEAFEAFFKVIPENSGMAFVVVAHLDPSHVSILPELLQKSTKMKVEQAFVFTVY
ncbi:MAG: hypothetical protein GY865_04675 [candidate division Zixibacteria bacterium]|nr:hypothetical protein [candidate division Zixibacteria bacterium]